MVSLEGCGGRRRHGAGYGAAREVTGLGAGRTHPHIGAPSEEQIARVLEGKTETVRKLYLDTHRLVMEALPEVAYSMDCVDGEMGYGAGQYGYDGWGMLALTPYTDRVSLAFVRGTFLEDRDGLFEGSGRTMRHVKIRSADQLAEYGDALAGLIVAASKLNRR